jgi:hypothetical protein
MGDPMWTNDFYAAIVALGGVTVIAKFVTHRSRDKEAYDKHVQAAKAAGKRNWIALGHTICVWFSLLAIVLALIGLGLEIDCWPYTLITGLPLVIALVILAIDGLSEDRST